MTRAPANPTASPINSPSDGSPNDMPISAPASSATMRTIPPPMSCMKTRLRLLILLHLGCSAALSTPDASAQGTPPVVQPPPPDADPSAPLPPLPDLGIAWPTADAPPALLRDTAPVEDSLVRYSADVEGLSALGLLGEFRAASALLRSKEPANQAQIRLRAEADVELATQLMRSRGYYAGIAAFAVTPAPAPGGEARIKLTATPSERYDYAQIKLPLKRPGPPTIPDIFGLKVGDPVDAAETLAAEGRVKVELPNLGHPFAEVGPLDVLIDHDKRQGFLTLPIDPGLPAIFGGFRPEIKPDIGVRHLGEIARFEQGETYNQFYVDDLRRALIATGLYSSVSVQPRRAGEAGGKAIADIAVTATPAPLRTIAAQLGYDTIDGIRAQASWRHRNLVPPEGAFTVRGVAGTRQQSIGADLVKSNFRERDRYLTLRFDISRQDTQAFESASANAGFIYEKRSTPIWQKRLTYVLGAEVLASRERDRSAAERGRRRTENYFLIALPLGVGIDTTKDLLDPRSGFRVDARLSPEASLQGDYAYARTRLVGTGYFGLRDRTVLAGRAATGAIIGTSLSNIAPSRRYYVGGGGSVRGYGFQDIGPKDLDDNPTGGRSFIEFSGEVRQQLSETIGVVAFFDGGQLYEAQYPDPSGGGFQYGAGIGARYYTSVGPIRVDVARALNPRRGDPDIALYFSIGQSF